MPVINCLVAATSTAAFLSLWFWVVHSTLHAKRSTVESAASQLAVSRESCVRAQNDAEQQAARAVLARSLDIYRQALALYDETRNSLWNYVPGRLMGFHRMPQLEEETLLR